MPIIVIGNKPPDFPSPCPPFAISLTITQFLFIMDSMRWLVLTLLGLVIFCSHEHEVFLTIEDINYTVGDFHQYCPTPFKSKIEADSAWHDFLLRKLLASLARERKLDYLPPLIEQIPIVEKSTIIKKFYEKMVKDKTPLTDQDFRRAYKEISTRVHLSQINFEKKKTAEFAYKMIKGGRPFDSMIPFFRNKKFFNGDMGYVPYHFLSDETRAEIKKLKAGDISKPFKELRHWKIIYLKDQKKDTLKSLAEIKSFIQGGLKERKERLYLKKMVDNLKKRYNLSYNDSLIPLLFLPRESIPPPDYNKWLVKMEQKEIKLSSIHDTLYSLYKTKGYDPRDVLDLELQNDLLYKEAIKNNYEKRFQSSVRKEVDDLMASMLYKSLILDSIKITNAELDSFMKSQKVKNRKVARFNLLLVKSRSREEKIIRRLEGELSVTLDSLVWSRLLTPKEE